jgi:hypothetical protein
VGLPWQDVSYLLNGNERQRRAYRALHSLGVFDVLTDHTPVLVGTIPIGVDVEDSDLDVVCHAPDLDRFSRLLIMAYGRSDRFRIKEKPVKGITSVVASFYYAGFRIEIFGQPVEVSEQHAYQHMVVEDRLLSIGGSAAREEIRRLKRDGVKTEPAFARYFGLAGDPYEMLLELSRLEMRELASVIKIQG